MDFVYFKAKEHYGLIFRLSKIAFLNRKHRAFEAHLFIRKDEFDKVLQENAFGLRFIKDRQRFDTLI